MEWVTNTKKFLLTFSLKPKQTMLNVLTYNGDDMFEQDRRYKQVIELINSEIEDGKTNDK